MNFKNIIFNLLNPSKYATDSDSVIIACYFNPQRNPYRLKAFREFYNRVKHMDILITECVIEGTAPELVDEFTDIRINRVWSKNLLWHKESLLNNLIQTLPSKYKYVFWVDTDVIFDNRNWLVDATRELRNGANLVQPFKYCVHLERNELTPSFDYKKESEHTQNLALRHQKMWHSFGFAHRVGLSNNQNYEIHGHVGFAWGARVDIVKAVPLYDKALVGGADHIIAHAATDYSLHGCITKSFTEDLNSISDWSSRFYKLVKGKVSFANGTLFHIWHGDVNKREYFKRIKEFTPISKTINKKDKNGLYISENDEETYVKKYFKKREETSPVKNYSWLDVEFMHSVVNDLVETNEHFIDTNTEIHQQVQPENKFEFGGGEFGGGGTGGDWSQDNVSNNIASTDNTINTFS
jgi:hypothetical protein